MADVEEVCPKCFETIIGGIHVCGSRLSQTNVTSSKQQAFIKQERKKYKHDVELETKQVVVVFKLDIPKGEEFQDKWLHDNLKERMEIPEGPEDYPEIEAYYIKDIW